ncbi:hypothetical protein DSM03_10676 [Leeuwenhoekiella aestuarii]|uniref:Uncharacterized protein n=1 Tax=Leeuwenhoekiella aestuarii TaxID=2249426 RepID=A0A4Q0NRE5_9FLAO|nr:hypothetical protein [Leeuwenhoekiella aestuarii]RXG12305.1 hypothetical protein DSM04_10776 [Leeuwenhoekiella aestuarii]RXG13738.1 hypothetical protein DSM03_10676 [Leeuwenhoekiella aestuarii]
MIKKLIFSITVLFALSAQAQSTDIARVEYMHIPFSNSDNAVGRFRALLQVPIPLDKDLNKIIVAGFEYRNVNVDIKDAVPAGFNIQDVSSLHRISGYVGYVWKPKENWRFGVKAGARINSNLAGSLVSDDWIYTASIYAINDMKDASTTKPYRWIFGLDYSTTPGRNFPLPLVNYYREFHPNWTYTLGVPKTNIRHYLNDDHKDALQAFVTLDNFFANIQNNMTINDQTAENISMTIILGGLGYEHFFTKHLLYYAYATHSINNDFRLRNNNRDDIYKINSDNTFYFRTGVKFKF